MVGGNQSAEGSVLIFLSSNWLNYFSGVEVLTPTNIHRNWSRAGAEDIEINGMHSMESNDISQ